MPVIHHRSSLRLQLRGRVVWIRSGCDCERLWLIARRKKKKGKMLFRGRRDLTFTCSWFHSGIKITEQPWMERSPWFPSLMNDKCFSFKLNCDQMFWVLRMWQLSDSAHWASQHNQCTFNAKSSMQKYRN